MLPLPAETVNDEYGNNRKPHAKQPPKDRRLSVRVTVLDLENWRFIATGLRMPLSAVIRRAVNEYVADPPPSSDLTDLKFSFLAELADLAGATIDRAELRKMTLCDKTIVLRVSVADRERWALGAQQEHCSVSAMIRRAVRRYVDPPFSELVGGFCMNKSAG